MKAALVTLFAMVLAWPAVVEAQYWGGRSGYTIVTPGEPPTFVNPSFNGGYTVITPGKPPTFINPSFNGGYTVITPGEPPTFVNPTFPAPPRVRLFGDGDCDDY